MTDSSREDCVVPVEHHKCDKMIGVADDAMHKGHYTVGSNWTGQKVVDNGLEPWNLLYSKFCGPLREVEIAHMTRPAVRGHMLELDCCKDRCSIGKHRCIG